MSLLGAVCGDVIGSTFERRNEKSININIFKDESTFTDDTVLTIAVADAILTGESYESKINEYGNNYPYRGYGGSFRKWLASDEKVPYESWANGSGMRCSAIGYAYESIDQVMNEAKKSAECTHNHPDGIKGAQAIAIAVYLARNNFQKKHIKDYIEKTFGYDLSFKIDDIRKDYKFDVSCNGSVPQAIVAFLESTNLENSIRLAISIGGDSDTIACMSASISNAFYEEIPESIKKFVLSKLPEEFIDIIIKFDKRFLLN